MTRKEEALARKAARLEAEKERTFQMQSFEREICAQQSAAGLQQGGSGVQQSSAGLQQGGAGVQQSSAGLQQGGAGVLIC